MTHGAACRALIVCAVAAAWLVSLPPVAVASRSQFTIFEAPRELMSPDASLRDRTIDEVRGLGARWLRLTIYWHVVAPDPNARGKPRGFDERDPSRAYDWTRYDRVVEAARARGMRILVTISGPVPTWATSGRRGHTRRPSRLRFQRFVTAVGRRYGHSVNYWSIWNEPNHPDFLTPQYLRGRPYSPRLYRGLFQAARRGLAASGNRNDRVLAGETAPRGTSRVVAPVDFVRGTLCLDARWRRRHGCGKLDVDGWAHHPYTTRQGPFFVPPDRDDVTIGVLGRLTRALDRGARARAVRRRTPVYLTEFGIQSEPDPYIGVSETRQAEYRSIAERIAWSNPRVRAFSQYLMRDDLPREGRPYVRYSGFESGLRHSGGAAKLAYEAFRLPLAALRVGQRRPRVRLWGLVRPADRTVAVRIDYRDRGQRRWRYLKADRTDARGYWRTDTAHRGGRSYRVRWIALDGSVQLGPRTRVYDPD